MKDSCIADDVKLGKNVNIYPFTNLYGCEIGDNSIIGTFVEIQKMSKIGSNCKISSHTFICTGVSIGENCFIGHGVMFINDNYPRSVNKTGELENEADWSNRFVKTIIGDNVSIGSNTTILGGIHIGSNSIVGAGSVLTKDVPSGVIVVGNPAIVLREVNEK